MATSLYKTSNTAGSEVRRRGKGISDGTYKPGDFVQKDTGQEYVPGRIASEAIGEDYRPGVLADRALQEPLPTPSQRRRGISAAPSGPSSSSPQREYQTDPAELAAWKKSQGIIDTPPPQDSSRPLEGDFIGDTGRSLLTGGVNIVKGIYEIGNLASGGALDEAIQSRTGTTGTENFAEGIQQIRGKDSPALQAQRKELEDAKGFVDSFTTVLTNPRLAGSMLFEMAPQLATVALAARTVAVKTFAWGLESGLGAEAASTLAATNATRTVLGVNSVLEGTAAGQDARSSILNMKEEELAKSPQYQKLLAELGDPKLARMKLANDASMVSTALAGTISLVLNKVTGAGALEGRILGGVTGVAEEGVKKTIAKEVAKGVAKETVQEAGEEGGSQFASNVGEMTSGARPDKDLLEGVPEAAGAGGALGGVSGGFFGGVSGLKGRTPTPDAAPGTTQTDQPQKEWRNNLTNTEMVSGANSQELMAHLYATGDEATRARLRAANPGLNLEALSQDVDLVNNGQRIAERAPGFVNQFVNQLETFDLNAATEAAREETRTTGSRGLTVAKDLAAQAVAEQEQGITKEPPAPGEEPAAQQVAPAPRREPLDQETRDLRLGGYQRQALNLMQRPPEFRNQQAQETMLDMLAEGYTQDEVAEVFAPIFEAGLEETALGYDAQLQEAPPAIQETEAPTNIPDAGYKRDTIEVVEAPVLPTDTDPFSFDQIVTALTKSDYEKTGGDPEHLDRMNYVQTKVPPEFQMIADALGIRLYGIKYLGKNPRTAKRNGISFGQRTIALNFEANKTQNQLIILGHELFHELARQYPKAAEDLQFELIRYLKQPERQAMRDKLLGVNYPVDKIREEMTADLVGLMFTDREFWQLISVKRPSLIGKILNVLDQLIAKYTSFGLREQMAKDMIDDLVAVRATIAEFFNNIKSEAEGNLEIAESVDLTIDELEALTEMRRLIRENKKPEASRIFKEQGFFTKYQMKFNEIVADEEAKAARTDAEVLADNEAYIRQQRKNLGMPPPDATTAVEPAPVEEPEVPFRRPQEEVDAENAYAAVQQIFDLLRREQVAKAAQVFRESNLAAFGESFNNLQDAVRQERTKRQSEALFKTEEQKRLVMRSRRTQFDKAVDKVMSGVTQKIEEKIKQRKALAISKAIAGKQARTDKMAAEFMGDETGKGVLADDTGGVFTQMAETGMYGGAEAQQEAIEKRASAEEARTESDRLAEEQAAIMSGRVRALLYSTDRGLDQLSKIRQEMAQIGYPETEIEATVGKAENDLRNVRDGELAQLVQSQLKDTAQQVDAMKVSKVEPEVYPQMEGIQDELDLNDQQRTDARRLAEAMAGKDEIDEETGEVKKREKMTFAEAVRAIRDNDIGLMHLYDQMRDLGMDIKKEYIDMSGNVSANHKLNDWVKKFPSSAMWARHAWFKSYEALPVKGMVQLTAGEQVSYDNWQKKMRELRTRRFEQEPGRGLSFMSLEQAFPNALFLNYTLNEMRNPDAMNAEDAVFIKEITDDPVRAWMTDIKFAVQARPDLEPQLTEYLTKPEMDAWQEFRAREFRESQRNLEMKMRSPIYSQLDSLRYLSPELYLNYRKEIATAEENQLQAVLQAAFEANEAVRDAMERGIDVGQTIGELMDARADEDSGYAASPDEINIDVTYDDDGNDIIPSESIRFRRGTHSGVTPGLNIIESLETAFSKWTNPPNYTVVQNLNQLPDDVRARLTQRFGNVGFKGAIDPKTGHIYILSDFHEDAEDAKFTMFHELYGHWGIRAFLGSQLDTFLNDQYRLNKKVRDAADKLRTEAEQAGTPMGQLESIEEAISDMAAAGDTGAFHSLIGKLARWLKKNGFENVAAWIDSNGDKELAAVLSGARSAARNQSISPLAGAPTEVMFNRAKDQPVEAYAYRDGKIKAYARLNPITGDWTVFTIKGDAQSITDGDFNTVTTDTLSSAHDLMKQFGFVKVAKGRETLQYIGPDNIVNIKDYVNDPSRWNRFKRWVIQGAQNQYLPIWEVSQQLMMAGKDNTVIDDLVKYEARTGYYIQDYQRTYLNPILKSLKALGDMGLSIEDVDLFLMAKHAEERNGVISAMTAGKNTKGSGMATKDAQKILKSGNNGAWDVAAVAEMEKISAKLNAMSQAKLNYLLQTGMITKFQYESLKASYKNYVNLSGNKETDLDRYDGSQLGGRAFNVRGTDTIRSTGRGTQAVDVLQNTLNSYVASLIRGQKNKPLQAILQMFEQNPDKTYVEVNPVETQKRINVEAFNFDNKVMKALGTDKATVQAGRNFLVGLKQQMERGEIDSDDAIAAVVERIRLAEERRDLYADEAAKAIRLINEQVVMTARLSPDGYVTSVESTTRNPQEVVVKVNGRSVSMVFNARSAEFFQAITGMNVQKSSAFFEALGAWGRFFSQMVTTWNPAWIPINMVRDVQTAISNMAADPEVGAQLAAKMAKEYKSSTFTAMRYMLKDYAGAKDGRFREWIDGMTTKHPLSPEDAKLIDEFYEDGGATFFLDRDSLELSLEKLNRAMKKADDGAWGWTKDKFTAFTDLMDVVSMPTEIAPRLAVYKVLREAGKSREFAARYAKELTVNFNLKGSSRELRSAYVFFNPAVQGTVRLFKDLKEGNYGRFATVAGFWMGLGFLSRMMARALSDDDDERPGVDTIDMVAPYKQNTSLTWFPGVIGGSIPVAYGWNVFSAAGQYAYDTVNGYMPATTAAMRTLSAAFDAFSPIGSGAESKSLAGSLVKTITPSAGVPVAEWVMNENRFGAPMYREQNPFSNVQESNAYMHFNSVNPVSKMAMQGLAAATNGGKNARYTPGLIDVNPAMVDHMINSYLPGVFSEVYKAVGLGINKIKGVESTKEMPIPLADRFKAVAEGEKFDQGADRRVREKVNTLWKAWSAPETTDVERREMEKMYPDFPKLQGLLQSQENTIKQMRQALTAVERDPRASDEWKVELRNRTNKMEAFYRKQIVEQALKSGLRDVVVGVE